MKQLDGGQKYFRMWSYTEKAAKKLEEEGFSTGYYDYEVSDWREDVQELVLSAWEKAITEEGHLIGSDSVLDYLRIFADMYDGRRTD